MEDTHKKFQGAEKIKRLLKWQQPVSIQGFMHCFLPRKSGGLLDS
jgi:hypothetical protein